MKNFNYFIGIDVSKETLDFNLVYEGRSINNQCIANNSKCINKLLREWFISYKLTWDTIVFCMEHTGIYNNPLLDVLIENKANIWLENPIHIKRSLGLVRGKNDKIDALRIALFAYKNVDDIKLWIPERKIIKTLKSLLSARERIIQAIENLTVPIEESKEFDKEIYKSIQQACKVSVAALKKDLQKINFNIKNVINNDERVSKLYKIITSVDNVGIIVATSIIVYTNEFIKIKNPKKFACYSGIAPFEHSSGKRIRGKIRVSKMANKYMKKLLHLSALGSVSRTGEMRDYYERKIAEGKNKMLILNAIRNKIILRIFACVNQNKIFEKNYKNNLVLA
jgi:transposase